MRRHHSRLTLKLLESSSSLFDVYVDFLLYYEENWITNTELNYICAYFSRKLKLKSNQTHLIKINIYYIKK